MTLTEIKAIRDRALKAYADALDAQSMGMNGRSLTRQNIDALRAEYEHWDRRVQAASGKWKPRALVRFTGA